jgi:NAD(P)H-dependent FMN reductase
MTIKILAFAGSSRSSSLNGKLVRVAIAGARTAKAEVTEIDLASFELPIFDEDVEANGRPPKLQPLKELFESHQGLLIACPEYNGSITPLLKNTIDWVSRPDAGKPPLAAFQGKIAGLLAASPGALGGLRGLVHVRAILGNLGVIVLPKQLAVAKANEAFDERGNLKDPKQQQTALEIGQQLAVVAGKLNG